jgi:membrane-bound lytic murein transglycosylase D
MSLVDKIPPLISALAFGYGVGMAAPDIDLDAKGTASRRGDVAYAEAPRRGPLPPAHSPSLEERLPGGESKALAELRFAHAPSRYVSDRDAERSVVGYSRESRLSSNVYEDEIASEMPELDEAESAIVSRLQLPDLGLGVSRSTLKYVRFFTRTDRGRGMFETWLKRSGRYQELITNELRARRLPEDLIWVSMIESGFDPTAKSPAGAVGLWQFMPATGAVYGLRQNKFVDQRKNPRLATQAAAHHLRDLYMRFGQWDLALAAYNMGYEQLLERIDRVGTTDFNELVRAGVMPSETSKYVPKILAAAIVANNLERFGFEDVELSRPVDAAELAVPPRTPLDVIAKAAGVSTSTIRKLNPDILGKEVPPGRGDFLVNVPPDTVSRTIAALPAMIEVNKSRLDDVDVLDPLDLMNPEGYRRPDPELSDESLLALLPKPKKRRALRDPVADDLGGLLDGPEVASKKRETVLYRVGAGDSLSSIASQFSVDADDVARDNGLSSPGELREGALIKLKVQRDLMDAPKPSRNADADERRPGKKLPKAG